MSWKSYVIFFPDNLKTLSNLNSCASEAIQFTLPHDKPILLWLREKLFCGENKQIFLPNRKIVYLFYFFLFQCGSECICFRFIFCERISWWNQEQMFVDKQFSVLYIFVSSLKRNVIWCALENSPVRLHAEVEAPNFFRLARNSISRFNEFSSAVFCFVFE